MLPLAQTLEKRGDRTVYIVLEPMKYDFATVPKGFRTDLVSAPKWARKWLPLKKMAHAAILHDFLCNLRPDLSKLKCNAVFRRQMKADGISFYWRWVVWAYVSRPGAPRVTWNQPDIEGAA